MRKSKLLKYGIFGLLYVVALLEIVLPSGLLDPRLLLWPNTKGDFIGVGLTSRFLGSFYYQYEVDGKKMHTYQLLSCPYQQSLKPGQTICVHYNSLNPEQSIVEPGFNALVVFETLFVMLLGLLLVVLGALSWCSGNKSPQTEFK